MDGRIFFVDGRQLSGLRTQDLPIVAKAICGFVRGFVSVELCYKREVGYVRLFAPFLEVYVLANQWQQIVPYLASGAMTPGVVAPQPVQSSMPKELGNLENWDSQFYQKVYATLQIVFPTSYPTSSL